MPSISPQNPNPIDRNADNPARQRRNWQRASQGALTNTIKTTLPISTGSTIGLALSTATGLSAANGSLGILFADASIAGSGSGIKVVESSTGGISTSALGIGLKLADTTLVLSSSGVKVGTLSSTNLPADVAYVDKANTFTALQTFNSTISFNVAQGNIFGAGSNTDIGLGGDGGLRLFASNNFNNNTGRWQVWAATTLFAGMYFDTGGSSIFWRASGAGSATILSITDAGVPGIFKPLSLTGVFGNTAAPGSSAGAGAGTGPTLSITGTDLAGKITLTTGTGPSASAVICTVTLHNSFASAPFVSLTPANAATAALGTAAAFPSTATGSFAVNSNTVALTAGTAYAWYYQVIG